MGQPAAAASTPVKTRTITEAGAHPQAAWLSFDSYPVEVFDLNGDGEREVIAHNDNRRVYVLDGRTGALLAELTTKFPPGWGARTINGIEAFRLRPGHPPSLVVANSAGYITLFDLDKDHSSASHLAFIKRWERRLSHHHSNPGMDSKVALADANRNGYYEIYAQVEEVGLYALAHDGRVLWSKPYSGGNAEPTVSDWDLDGKLEVLFFSDDGWVRVFDAFSGRQEWVFDAKSRMGYPASIPRAGTVAQVDGQGKREVVFCARDAHDQGNFTRNHMGLFVVGNDDGDGWGNVRWWRQPSWAAPLCYTRPVVYDGNANGQPEIYGMDWNTIGHSPGDWERTGPAHVFAFSWDGRELWRTTLDTWWSNKDIAIADLDQDGRKEVLANGPGGEGDGHDGWWLLNLQTGAKERFLDVHPYKTGRAPRLADLDGDQDTDLAMPVAGHASGTTPGEGAWQYWDARTGVQHIVWSSAEDRDPRPA